MHQQFKCQKYKLLQFETIEILNMRENRDHARCNAFGLRYAFKK